MPALAMLAVMLCTAMVLIVWSIMGGFLSTLLSTGREYAGDVSISWPTVGFGHYEQLITDLEALPQIAYAAPLVEAFGVISLPTGQARGVVIKGIDPPSYSRVTAYDESLWWRPVAKPLPRDRLGEDPRLATLRTFIDGRPQALFQRSPTLPTPSAAFAEIAPAIQRSRQKLESVNLATSSADVLAQLNELERTVEAVRTYLRALPAALDANPTDTQRAELLDQAIDGAEALLDPLPRARDALIAHAERARRAGVAPPDVSAALDAFDPAFAAVQRYAMSVGRLAETISVMQRALDAGRSMRKLDPTSGELSPAVVLGIEVTGYTDRTPEGFYKYQPQGMVGARLEDGGVNWTQRFVPDQTITLHMLPASRTGRFADVRSISFPVANEFRTGVFEIDQRTVYMPLAEAQRILKMDAAVRTELIASPPQDPFGADVFSDDPSRPAFAPREVISRTPARVTTVIARAAQGFDQRDVREAARTAYIAFAAKHADTVPDPMDIAITTWEDSQATLIGAVQKETALVLFILMVISFVASFLILAIFWAMVSEKTKDIGVLRSVGASSAGVAWLWLRYGLIIGFVGSALGLVLATTIVWNINPIHEWLGAAFNLYIWDPRVYYFAEIPSKVQPDKALIVFIGGLSFSVLGALVPALRAALMHPVNALRFE